MCRDVAGRDKDCLRILDRQARQDLECGNRQFAADDNVFEGCKESCILTGRSPDCGGQRRSNGGLLGGSKRAKSLARKSWQLRDVSALYAEQCAHLGGEGYKHLCRPVRASTSSLGR